MSWNDIIINSKKKPPTEIQVAVLDFDGTISTLRCGWEQVMEDLFLKRLRNAPLQEAEILNLIRSYIDESTGTQTIFQMEWLAEQVRELCGENPLDPWEYKDEYNQALLWAIRERFGKLESGHAKRECFLVPGSLEFLNLLREKGVDVYIASGTDHKDVCREAELLGVLPLVKLVKGAPPRKKDCSKEAVIRDIIENSSVSGSQMMVIGDGKVEIQLGREAGAFTVGIASNEQAADGNFSEKKLEKLKKIGADLIAPDFRVLLRAFEN